MNRQALANLVGALAPRKLFGALGGRSFLVICFFAGTGFCLALGGKLTPDYAALAAALSGFHVWRARGEDRANGGNGS